MKTLILAAFVVIIGLASCSVTEPNDRVYYPQQRIYTDPAYQYDPYYNPYATRRVYDYNTGRYYDVPVYGSPVYTTPVYPNRTYSRDYRRDREYRRDNVRRDYYQNTQPVTQPQRVEQPRERRLPDGTRISPDGTVTLPNGEVRRRQ